MGHQVAQNRNIRIPIRRKHDMELKIMVDDASIARLADAIAARLSADAPRLEPVPAATSEKPLVTLGDLRGIAKQLVAEKGAAGRDVLISVLSGHGAKNLTTLPTSKFAEVADRLKLELEDANAA